MMPRSLKKLLAIAFVSAMMAAGFAVLPRAEAHASTGSPVSAVAVHQSPATPEAVIDGARMDDGTSPVLWPTSHKTRQFAVTETPGVETNKGFRPEPGARALEPVDKGGGPGVIPAGSYLFGCSAAWLRCA